MKSASNTPNTALPEHPRNNVTAGMDWARDDHAVCIVDGRGHKVATTIVDHTSSGLRALVTFLGKHGVAEVAIERPDGPVIDTLLDADLTVVVISPNHVKNLRGRYGSAGNKDDRFDAFVLADTLRTDRGRLRPFQPDARARSRCDARAGPARTWSRTALRSPTNSVRTCGSCSRVQPTCSPNWTPRSVWPS